MIVIIFITNQYKNNMLFISPFANQIELQIKTHFKTILCCTYIIETIIIS